MTDYQIDFISNLKKYRQNKNLSQAELAEKCDVTTGTIGNIECCLAKPSFDSESIFFFLSASSMSVNSLLQLIKLSIMPRHFSL